MTQHLCFFFYKNFLGSVQLCSLVSIAGVDVWYLHFLVSVAGVDV